MSLGGARLPEAPLEVPKFTDRLLPSTVCLWNETRLLNRYLYKMRNQHRSTPYFHRLQQITRSLKRLQRVELCLQDAHERRAGTLEVTSAWIQIGIQLCHKVKESSQLAYKHLEHIYSDGYFVPLTVTGLAMVSRINACASQLLQEMEAVPQRIKLT